MKIEKIKTKNIIDMGMTFSAMGRVFEKGSTKEIKDNLQGLLLGDFSDLNTKDGYKEIHETFCEWLTNNIKTARGDTRNASWGHAAKVIDVVLKVCIYYCELPSKEESRKILPELNGAIDTSILGYLKKEYNNQKISKITSLKEINREKYEILQEMIRKDIKQNHDGDIYPVQWDDKKWREYNR